ncbi:hypothetical protein [Pseudomonas sp. 5P_3.1_Bac2]|uniref:hypothetical protein n=1 Tax=Pseudomonas sp. 5P_3.1_Bac2 TaxID=2971617 RepID=UPI0021C86A54|nr:hypothetical protein [Pseudomonas sp. 5P_3.1_Bac2]MCU1718964.1 hypothetical protein [Pseudomonas sp. 5P_3.1_Bac2]
MSFFEYFRKKPSPQQVRNQAVDNELDSLRAFYPVEEREDFNSAEDYPKVTDLTSAGLGAYSMNIHVSTDACARVKQLIADLGLTDALSSGDFHTYRNGAEAVSLQSAALGKGISLLLITNSSRLLHALTDVSPPAPWLAFPTVDASVLGSLQGELEHWWQSYWWPYWQSLTHEQRKNWLLNPDYPEAWREYIQLQEAFATDDRESSI